MDLLQQLLQETVDHDSAGVVDLKRIGTAPAGSQQQQH